MIGESDDRPRSRAGRWGAFAPALAILLLALWVALPLVRDTKPLLGAFAGAIGVLGAWWAVLFAFRRERAPVLGWQWVPAHGIQAAVQLCIYAYWGYHWREIRAEAPLIAAQVVFLYALQGLIAWSRGRSWTLGLGPWPVILSTNLLLWFKAEWFFLQFAMVAAGALGKEFVQWRRGGRLTHIFNPSVFGQTLAALALIATASTYRFTWGAELAASFETLEHAYLLIFALGLIVQYLFSTTLVTLGATLALVGLNLVYTEVTGLYYFVSVNIGATIFLGLHLLVTDPATSPRGNCARLLFGAAYGAMYFGLFRVFDGWGVPAFWDKLLPVPILNLLVPAFERLQRTQWLAPLETRWQAVAPARANVAHIGIWAVLFLSLYGSGFLGGKHPGDSRQFWLAKAEWGDERAREVLIEQLRYGAALSDPESMNMLGALALDGNLIERDLALAANLFARASELGHGVAAENTLALFLFQGAARSLEDVALAARQLERDPVAGNLPQVQYMLGILKEDGRLSPPDAHSALAHYRAAADLGHRDAARAAFELIRRQRTQ